jgi:hypothetical protein
LYNIRDTNRDSDYDIAAAMVQPMIRRVKKRRLKQKPISTIKEEAIEETQYTY